MRGIGNHTPPAETQDMPADNTTADVNQQVAVWYVHPDQVIHPEIAREIAAWWQASDERGQAFAEFASTGTISLRLEAAIQFELGQNWNVDQAPALKALARYVYRALSDGTRFAD